MMVLRFLTNIFLFLFRGSFTKNKKGENAGHNSKFYSNTSAYYGKIKMTQLEITKTFFLVFIRVCAYPLANVIWTKTKVLTHKSKTYFFCINTLSYLVTWLWWVQKFYSFRSNVKSCVACSSLFTPNRLSYFFWLKLFESGGRN